jgi:hypothetical protein
MTMKLSRVVYVPSQFRVWDFIAPDGLTLYGRRTLADIQATEAADAVEMDADEAHRLHCEHFRAPVTEITREQYWYALEVLPPCRWRGIGDSFETFHISERVTANIVNWYCQTRTERGERYFTLTDYETLRPDELAERVAAFLKGAQQ